MQIHELNNFTGTLGSGAYLAIDNGTDTGKISSQSLLAATEARIDNIIAGDAPSAAEVTDARYGADGVTYSSLGTAIRTQFSDVKSELMQEQTGFVALESGTYQDANGKVKNNINTRIRNAHIMKVSKEHSIVVPSGYSIWIFMFDKTQSFLGAKGSWLNGNVSIDALNANTEYINFAIRKDATPSADISGDVSTVQSSLQYIDNNSIRQFAKNNAKNGADGVYSIGSLADFVNGTTYSGVIQTYGFYRIANPELISFAENTTLYIKSGFQISVAYFVNGSFSSATGWESSSYTVLANSTVRICIRRATEDSAEVADINEFTNAVTIKGSLIPQINNAFKSFGQISSSNISSLGYTSVKDLPDNYAYGISYDITSAMLADLPSYGRYGTLIKIAGINPNIYRRYEFTDSANRTWVAWQTNNNSDLSVWKELANVNNAELQTVSERTLIDSNSKVILIGDSIVAGVGGTGWQQTSGRFLLTYDNVDLYANDDGTCWANMMVDYLEANYGCTAYNNGLSGFNSVNIPQNISSLVPSDTTHVIACWGINDRAYNYDTVSGYQTVIDYCNSIGAKIVPLTICPCLQPNSTYSHTQYEILTRIKTVCANNNLEVCDLWSAVNNFFYTKGIALDTNYIPDNLHPNDAMYTIMYNLIRSLLGV